MEKNGGARKRRPERYHSRNRRKTVVTVLKRERRRGGEVLMHHLTRVKWSEAQGMVIGHVTCGGDNGEGRRFALLEGMSSKRGGY